MKAIKLHSLQDIRLEELPVPEIAENEALVRMKACGICGSDTMDWYVAKKTPFIPGHEPAGVVEDVGAAVKKFKPGDRVFVHHHAPCFDCKYCDKKQYVLCATWKATNLDPGGLAEFFRVPAVNLRGDTLHLPATLSFEDGALIEPTACVVKSFSKIDFQRSDTMLVIGLGVMGLMHILLGRHYGLKKIIGADRVPYRLKKALEFGADAVIDVGRERLREKLRDLTRGQSADLVIIGPGSIAAMESALSCVGKGGTALFFTPSPDQEVLRINPFYLYFNEINLVFSYSCGPNDTREAMSLIEQGIVTAAKLVTHKYPLEDAEKAIRKTVEAGESMKTLVVT